MSETSEQYFSNASDAALALAEAVGAELRAGLKSRGAASLVVSGGRSPIPFFVALRGMDLEWSKVLITLADERWVPVTSEHSNEALVREHLLQDRAAFAKFMGLKTADDSPMRGISEINEKIANLARPFDVVVLGMGTDGHTASLFPGMPALTAMLNPRWALHAATATAPTVPKERVTLTLRALLDTRHIFLPIAGAAKREVYEQARGGDKEYPVSAVLCQRYAPVHVLISDQG